MKYQFISVLLFYIHCLHSFVGGTYHILKFPQVEDQQTRINNDLEFILTQLRDLEQCIAPLEKDGDSYLSMKSEPQRKQLYLTATQIDSQMKRLSEDLKEVRKSTAEVPKYDIGRPKRCGIKFRDNLVIFYQSTRRLHQIPNWLSIITMITELQIT